MRRSHGVKLPNVRSALDYVRKQFKSTRPLIDQAFQTDGLDLFLERYGWVVFTIGFFMSNHKLRWKVRE